MTYSKLTYFIIQSMIILFLISCVGDMFTYNRKIIGNYYLVKSEKQNGLIVSYKIGSGDFVGRVPERVTEYGVVDTFLIVKTRQNNIEHYFLINMKKDSEYGKERDFLIGPLDEDQYKIQWGYRFNIPLTKVKD